MQYHSPHIKIIIIKLLRFVSCILVFWLTATTATALLETISTSNPMCGFIDPVPCSRLDYFRDTFNFTIIILPITLLQGLFSSILGISFGIYITKLFLSATEKFTLISHNQDAEQTSLTKPSVSKLKIKIVLLYTIICPLGIGISYIVFSISMLFAFTEPFHTSAFFIYLMNTLEYIYPYGFIPSLLSGMTHSLLNKYATTYHTSKRIMIVTAVGLFSQWIHLSLITTHIHSQLSSSLFIMMMTGVIIFIMSFCIERHTTKTP